MVFVMLQIVAFVVSEECVSVVFVVLVFVESVQCGYTVVRQVSVLSQWLSLPTYTCSH